MKKIIFLSIMLFAVAITGCEKNEVEPKNDPIEQTLEELYPEWVNLTKVLTDGSTVSNMNPIDVFEISLEIKILNNQVHYLTSQKGQPTPNDVVYEKMSISGDTVNFYYYKNQSSPNLYQRFEKTSDNKIKIFVGNTDKYYLLKIN